MDRPRTAVTSSDAPAGGAEEKRACGWVGWVDEVGEVKVPRRRKMAEGLSLESLWEISQVGMHGGKRTYIPSSWKPRPGQKKCTVAP